MKKTTHSTESWDVHEEIFSMQMGTLLHVKEALKSGKGLKMLTFTSWIFTFLSIASITIAVTAPFDQVAVQANIFNQLQAPTFEKLDDTLFFSSFDARDQSRHVTPGAEQEVVGTVYAHTLMDEVKLSGLVPCVKNLVSTPRVTDLHIFDGENELKSNSTLVIPPRSTKALVIKGNISEDTAPGNRFQVGICEAPKAETKNGSRIQLEKSFPVYSDPASVVGHVRVIKKPAK